MLLISFTIIPNSNNVVSQLLYLGSIYSLIRANTFIRDFMGGLTTDISSGISGIRSLLSKT